MTAPTHRLFDLLVVVAIAGGLLALAWSVARQRGLEETVPLATAIASPSLLNTPELQLVLPLEKFGMQLTREPVAGEAQRAVADLEHKCQEVLASADEWVLSLAVSPEEQQLLDSLVRTEPLTGPLLQFSPTVQLFPLTHPTGRAGVRVDSSSGGPLTPALALAPTVESPEKIESRVGERGRKKPTPESGDSSAGTYTAAAVGRRLICWGFITAEGTAGQTVWFARPREKLPRAISPEGHAP